MYDAVPESLAIVAGRGVYPLLLAQSARTQGVRRLFAIAFKGETDPAIEGLVDTVKWIRLGQFQRMLEELRASGIRHAVMVGLITPTHLFNVRLDRLALSLLRTLKERNAHTIFGTVAEQIRAQGLEVLPASTFMQSHMPEEGVLSARGPDPREKADIELGLKVAEVTSELDVGQTVVVKEGTILAVEAFEGTDETIRRAARLGGPGAVVVKVAKRGHDMRFDIPTIGLITMKVLRKAGVTALALQAGRSIILERDKVIREANRMNLSLVAVRAGWSACHTDCSNSEYEKRSD
ncbi:MAG: UDP-2,3-diacylglucosamine diphosphatase LpxI [Kiritimatiellae bacterium]|nr:UDP-2,3-diacylglucosamine diphosphatase LpxI [Kiritimatiellia bacterium]